MADGLTCDRCGGGHGPWDSYAEGRILLCSACRENVPDSVRYPQAGARLVHVEGSSTADGGDEGV